MWNKTLHICLNFFYIIIIIFHELQKIFDGFYAIGGVVKNQLKIAIFSKKKDHIFKKFYSSEYCIYENDNNKIFLLKGCHPCLPEKMLSFENFSLIAQVSRWFSLRDVDTPSRKKFGNKLGTKENVGKCFFNIYCI